MVIHPPLQTWGAQCQKVSQNITSWSHDLITLTVVGEPWNSMSSFKYEEHGVVLMISVQLRGKYFGGQSEKNQGWKEESFLRTSSMMEWQGPVKSIRAQSPGWAEAIEESWGQQRHFSYQAENKENKDHIDASLRRAAGVYGTRKRKEQLHSAQGTSGQRMTLQVHRIMARPHRKEEQISTAHFVSGQGSWPNELSG